MPLFIRRNTSVYLTLFLRNKALFYFLPSAALRADQYCRRSLRTPGRPSFSPSVRLYVRPERFYQFNFLRISAISPEFGGMMHSAMEQIAIYNGHVRHFEIFLDIFLARSQGRRYRFNSLRISGISLKFGGMMHSNMKEIAISSDHSHPIFVRSVKLWNFPW